MNNPLVSIVIPTYNREQYIEDAIKSAINQTYRNIEIIIVDNCSTDSTWDILNRWAERDERIKVFRNKMNIGPVLNWNECFEHTSGDFIKILWSDDWMAIDFIEKAMAVFDATVAFVISWHQIISEDGSVLSNITYKKELYSTEQYFSALLYIDDELFPVSPSCALFRKKDILSSFVYTIPNDDQLDSKCNGAGNDLLLFLNTAVHYSSVKVLPYYLNYFRAHKESFSIANNLELYYLWSKVFFLETVYVDKYYLDVLKLRFFVKYYLLRKKEFKNIYNHIVKSNFFISNVMKYIFDRYLKIY
ncbi:glycosyltransferase family 2 protein [Bacteroides fragilis]